MNLDRREISRYLGAGSVIPARSVEELISACQAQLEQNVHLQRVSRKVDVSALNFPGEDLKYHLRNCRQAFLLAITMGSETDRLLRRWSVENMAKAAVGQACAAVWMDNLVDDYLLELEQALGPGQYLLPPFSPGYGDFPLSSQGELLTLLDARRRIGVALTAGGMLVPEKTVTAVAGISGKPEEKCIQKCWSCTKTNCKFRKGSGA